MSAAARTFKTPAEWIDDAIQIRLIGAGGTGSHLADQLASLHVTLRALGHPGLMVSVEDGDTVELHNTGRQRFTAADRGVKKASVIVHRINNFYGTDWKAVPEYHNPRHGPGYHCDIIITAVDKAAYRATLAKAHFHRNTIWIDAGNGARKGQCLISTPGLDKADTNYLPTGRLEKPPHPSRRAAQC